MPAATARNLPLVVFWMSGAVLSFSAAAVAIRILARTLSVSELLTIRSGGGVLIVGAVALFGPGSAWARIAPRRPWMHLARDLPHFVGQWTWSYGITVLPLATVFALEFTAPLWVAVLAVLFLREPVTPARMGAAVLGLVGVVVILQPGSGTLAPANLVVLAAAFAFAVTAVVTRKLVATDTTWSILFWMNVIQLPLNLLASDPWFLSRLEPSQWGGALGLCATGVLSHYCWTQAYRYGDASVVIPLDFLRIPLIALVGVALYGEALEPRVFVGAAIIIAGISWNLWAEARRPAPP